MRRRRLGHAVGGTMKFSPLLFVCSGPSLRVFVGWCVWQKSMKPEQLEEMKKTMTGGGSDSILPNTEPGGYPIGATSSIGWPEG